MKRSLKAEGLSTSNRQVLGCSYCWRAGAGSQNKAWEPPKQSRRGAEWVTNLRQALEIVDFDPELFANPEDCFTGAG